SSDLTGYLTKYLQKCNSFQDQIYDSCTGINGFQLQGCYVEQIDKVLLFLLIDGFKDLRVGVLKQGRERNPYVIIPLGFTTDIEIVFSIMDTEFQSYVTLA